MTPEREDDTRFSNREYTARVVALADDAVALVIRRFDGLPIRDWRHLQAIKNEIVGPHREAVEYYPPADRGYPVSATVRVLICVPPADPDQPPDGRLSVVVFPRDVRVLLDDDERAGYVADRLPDGWIPIRRLGLSPEIFQVTAAKDPVAARMMRAWGNDAMNGTSTPGLNPDGEPGGMLYLSFKFDDRRPENHRAVWADMIRAAAGPQAEGTELFPDEDRLMDESNQWHLFAVVDPVPDGALGTMAPDGASEATVTDVTGVPVDRATGRLTYGRNDGAVVTPDQLNASMARLGYDVGKAKQRPWQPGLPTGPGARGSS